MKKFALAAVAVAVLAGCAGMQGNRPTKSHAPVADAVIAKQNATLAANTAGKGYGPQSPRDIDASAGANAVVFAAAPAYQAMNLCNIHFHRNAEHKGGEFTQHAGNGDGNGYDSGYKYTGKLSASEMAPVGKQICHSKQGGLAASDTIELHYVYSTAPVKPGPTLGACLSDAVKNPQLRVETQVFVAVNDANALDFKHLTAHGVRNGFQQALNLPTNTGVAVQYAGSTTGPGYNEVASPLLVSWSVRPKVAKVNIETIGQWCEGNVFNEDHGHGVRNLVIEPALLSNISR